MEWWQIVTAVGGGLVILDRAAGVLERIGGVYGRVGHFLQRTYAERAAAEKRDAALTKLITNGINEKVERVGQFAETAALQAQTAVSQAQTAVEQAQNAVVQAAEAASIAVERAAVVEARRVADRAALDDHITQSMEEHSGLGIQITKLMERVGEDG